MSKHGFDNKTSFSKQFYNHKLLVFQCHIFFSYYLYTGIHPPHSSMNMIAISVKPKFLTIYHKCPYGGNNQNPTFLKETTCATPVFPLSSFCLSSNREIRFFPGISLVETGDSAGRWPSPAIPPWSNQFPHGRLGQWRGIWGPERSRSSSPQYSRPVSRRSSRIGHPCPQISSRDRGSPPFLCILYRGWTTSPVCIG